MKKVIPKPSGQKKQKTEFGNNFLKKNIIPSLIILILGIGLYASTHSFKYVLDDKMIITDNSFTNEGFSGIGKIFSEESFTGYFQSQQNLVAGSRYRPLSIASFAVENSFFKSPKDDGYGNLRKDANGKQLFTGNPAISHILNAIFYAITGLLLFRLLFLLFPGSENNKWYLSVPFAAAIIFISHPIHTEVVANIKSRDEIFALLFSLAALYFTLRHSIQKGTRNLLMASACFFLALLSKENAFTFLIIIPLTIYFFTKSNRKTILASTVPLLIVAFIYLIVRIKVIGHLTNRIDDSNIMNSPFFGMSFSQKISTIIYTLGCYVKLSFFPHPLTNDYYPYAVPIMNPTNWKTLVSILLYAGLGYVTIKGFRKKDPVSYSILFFLIALSLVSNIFFPVGSFMNERFLYFSSIGFCIAISYLLLQKLPSLIQKHTDKIRLAGIGIIAGITIFFSFLTINRLPAWENNFTLFETDVKTSSNSAFSNCFMGVGLYQQFIQAKDDSTKKELLNRAEYYERISLKIYPDYYEALHNLSGIIVQQFEFDRNIEKLLNNFYDILTRITKPEYVDSYLRYLNGQRVYNDSLLKFYHKLGYEFYFKGQNKRDKAIKYIELGLQIMPDNSLLNNERKEIQSGSSFLN